MNWGGYVMGRLFIRSMNRTEVDWAVERAAMEGWNPGLHDAAAFWAQDPEGFLIGMLDGKPIASVSAVAYEGGFGFIGFYIVDPAHRGQGYGMQLWQSAIRRLEGRTIGLDGVIEQVPNYKKSGFTLAYSNIRYEFISQPDAFHHMPGTIPITQIPFDTIAHYDRELFQYPRTRFLRTWLHQPAGAALAMVQGGEIRGYGVVRPCRVGFKIGPLFADDQEVADSLFRSLCAEIRQEAPVYLDVPEVNPNGIALARSYNMEKVFGTARMYKNDQPILPTERIFGVTTFELG